MLCTCFFSNDFFLCLVFKEAQAKPQCISVPQEEVIQVSIAQTVISYAVYIQIIQSCFGVHLKPMIFFHVDSHKKEKKKDKEREKDRDRDRREDRDRSRDERERSSSKKKKSKDKERDRDRKSDSEKGDVKVCSC